MRRITLIIGVISIMLLLHNGFSIEDTKKVIEVVLRLVQIGVKAIITILKLIKAVLDVMDQMTRTIGEPTCPEEAVNGVYPLNLAQSTIPPFRVYCEKGGWIVIHRRFKGKLNFDRKWDEYRNGFGDIQDEFWLGLEKLHQITRTGSFELMVVLKGFGGDEKWAKFEGFRVASEFEQYRLDLKQLIAGNLKNSISGHNGMKFSTSDRDNDTSDYHCAQFYKSGWWFKNCYDSNLNGLYGQGETNFRMSWYSFNQKFEGLKEARMMIRHVQECQQQLGFSGAPLLD